MRKLALATLAILAGCSDDGDGPDKAAAATAVKMQPGQWETTFEITSMTMADKSMPAAKGGTKTTASSCVTPEQVDKPEGNLFAGSKGACKYDNFYMANGRINASMSCDQPGMKGKLMSNVSGTYTATSFTTDIDMATYTGAGDFKMVARASGKRVGECVAPEPAAKG